MKVSTKFIRKVHGYFCRTREIAVSVDMMDTGVEALQEGHTGL